MAVGLRWLLAERFIVTESFLGSREEGTDLCLHALRDGTYECEILVAHEFSVLVNVALGHTGHRNPSLRTVPSVNTEMPVLRFLVLSLGLGYESQTALTQTASASLKLKLHVCITISINIFKIL